MIADVVADPIALSADERYFCGHYLAYLLGGSRRQGFLRRRPLDPLNADRARLLLAMTWLMIRGAGRRRGRARPPTCWSRGSTSGPAQPDRRAKYLAARDTAGQAQGVPPGPQAAPGGQPLRRGAG